MSYAGIERVDYTKGNRGDRLKLMYLDNGEPAHYRIRVKAARGAENPDPPTLPWFAIDFEVMKSSHPDIAEGEEAGNAWTVGGQWGHLAFQDLKAFLALALELPPAKAAKIDRSCVLYCMSDEQPLAGKEFDVIASQGTYGKRSPKAGQHFTKVWFKPPKDAI